MEEELTKIYLNIQIDYNKKSAINSELDIYIPSLKLAIELNGIFHYKPIYGEKKFNQIKANDLIKKQECIKNNITLIIIDMSNYKLFKIKTAEPYLKIIQCLIGGLLQK